MSLCADFSDRKKKQMLPECNNTVQIYLESKLHNYTSYCHLKITKKYAVSQFSQLSIQGRVKKKLWNNQD